jgi:signal peptidase I
MAVIRKIYFIILDFLQDIVVTLVMALALFLTVYFFLFRPFQVDGSSMFPNYLNGEYLLTNIISLRVSEPHRGDVIVFNAPPDPGKYYIKRLIGLPGDSIVLKDGDVYLNGKLLNESAYLKPSVKTYGLAYFKDNQEIKVPTSDYFVLGDNREESSDSREWGFVPKDQVIGISFFVYWPLNEAKVISNPY